MIFTGLVLLGGIKSIGRVTAFFVPISAKKVVKYYRIVFVLAVFVGAVTSLELVWTYADITNGLMTLPNLVGLLGLSGVVMAETHSILKKIKEEKRAA